MKGFMLNEMSEKANTIKSQLYMEYLKYLKKSSKNKFIQRTDFWLPKVGSKGQDKFLIKETEKEKTFAFLFYWNEETHHRRTNSEQFVIQVNFMTPNTTLSSMYVKI